MPETSTQTPPAARPQAEKLAVPEGAVLTLDDGIGFVALVDRMREDSALIRGANVWRGDIVCEGVAESLGLDYTPVASLIGA